MGIEIDAQTAAQILVGKIRSRRARVGVVGRGTVVPLRSTQVDAAATKPFAFMPFCPGPGLGGRCIPIDPLHLSWRARQAGIETRFIELAGHISSQMPHFVVDKVQNALNEAAFDYRALVERAPLIVDARDALKGIRLPKTVRL